MWRTQKNTDELRQFAIEHGRRIRFRLKYNIAPDDGHEKYEGRLYTAYCLDWYVCPYCGNDQEVSESLKKRKKLNFSNSQLKSEETELGAAEMEEYGRLNNICTSCEEAEYVSTKKLVISLF